MIHLYLHPLCNPICLPDDREINLTLTTNAGQMTTLIWGQAEGWFFNFNN